MTLLDECRERLPSDDWVETIGADGAKRPWSCASHGREVSVVGPRKPGGQYVVSSRCVVLLTQAEDICGRAGTLGEAVAEFAANLRAVAGWHRRSRKKKVRDAAEGALFLVCDETLLW